MLKVKVTSHAGLETNYEVSDSTQLNGVIRELIDIFTAQDSSSTDKIIRNAIREEFGAEFDFESLGDIHNFLYDVKRGIDCAAEDLGDVEQYLSNAECGLNALETSLGDIHNFLYDVNGLSRRVWSRI